MFIHKSIGINDIHYSYYGYHSLELWISIIPLDYGYNLFKIMSTHKSNYGYL